MCIPLSPGKPQLHLKIPRSSPQIKDVVKLKWATQGMFPVTLLLSGAVWDMTPHHTTLGEWQIPCAHSLEVPGEIPHPLLDSAVSHLCLRLLCRLPSQRRKARATRASSRRALESSFQSQRQKCPGPRLGAPDRKLKNNGYFKIQLDLCVAGDLTPGACTGSQRSSAAWCCRVDSRSGMQE